MRGLDAASTLLDASEALGALLSAGRFAGVLAAGAARFWKKPAMPCCFFAVLEELLVCVASFGVEAVVPFLAPAMSIVCRLESEKMEGGDEVMFEASRSGVRERVTLAFSQSARLKSGGSNQMSIEDGAQLVTFHRSRSCRYVDAV